MMNAGTKSLGRPRDETLTPCVMETARNLVVLHGYAAVTLNLISRDSGIARQSLLRRWSTKADLVVDAFFYHVSNFEAHLSKDVESALGDYFSNIMRIRQDDAPGLRNLWLEAQKDPELFESLRNRFIVPRTQVVENILRAAVSRGELKPQANLPFIVQLIQSFLWYRILLGEPFDKTVAHDFIRILLQGIQAPCSKN
jgi:AcrR family transcriptional regulator